VRSVFSSLPTYYGTSTLIFLAINGSSHYPIMIKVDLVNLISPLFWISRPLGLLPISHKNGQFVVKRSWLIYSVCTTIFCFVFGVLDLYQMMWRAASQPQDGESILLLFTNSILYLISLLNVYYLIGFNSTLCRIFQQLDALLKILARERDFEKTLLQIRNFTVTVQVYFNIVALCNFPVLS